MKIYFTTTGKKPNSTAAVSFTGVTPYECFLKTPTSVEHPEVILTEFLPSVRYAWIPDFNRYYFIEDITAIGNERHSYTLSVDVLGTYRTAIRSLQEYCSRSSSGSDMLPDPLITHNNTINLTTNIGTWTAPGPEFTNGIFALETVSGGTSSGQGSTTIYLLGATAMANLMAEVFNASSTIYGNDITDDSVKTYFDPFKYIISCRWFPFNPGTGSDPVRFGFWTSTYTGIKIGADFGFTLSGECIVPKPNGDVFQSYGAEWVKHDIFVPGFGQLPIDSKFSGKTIVAFIACDYSTGAANLELTCDGKLIGTASGQLGVPVQLSQLSVDVSNVGTTLIGGIESASGGLISQTINNEHGMIGSMIARTVGILGSLSSSLPIVGDKFSGGREALSPALSTCGTNGNRCYLYESHGLFITTRYYTPDNATAVHARFNRPDDQVHTLSTLSGYTVVQLPYTPNIGTATEAALIASFLSGGVYIE